MKYGTVMKKIEVTRKVKNMNLTNFLKQTDTLTAKYTAEQLGAFIHDIARVLPEMNREDFLKRLREVTDGGSKHEKNEQSAILNLDSVYHAILEDFEVIDEGEVSVHSELNEEYDDWYGGEEFFYEDPENIGRMLQRACDFIHTCMDAEEYDKGLEIGQRLFRLHIVCYSEYENEDFSVHDMVGYDFLDCSLRNVVLDTLYCGYHAVSMKKRPEVLYEVITSARENDVTLEAVLQHGGDEIQDFPEFLKEWINYLGNLTDRFADQLFLEAVELCNDTHAAGNYAKKYATLHPALYLKILEHPQDLAAKELIMLGEEALKYVPKKYRIRGSIALKTAEYRLAEKKDRESVKEYYITAFESNTTAVNYLRGLLNGLDKEEDRKKLSQIQESFDLGKNSDRGYGGSVFGSERAENEPDTNTLLSLRFLDGRFEEVMAKGLNESKGLGWSGTFMKQGIAMYLLALYEGKWTKNGIRAMAELVKDALNFSPQEYRRGLGDGSVLNSKDEEKEIFYHVITQWKQMTPMESELKEKSIKKIEKLLEKRTAAIMEANRRNYYGECAAYIAALGEVKESLGEVGAKQRLMSSYKEKYSRRSAFRAEMKAFGWRG